MTNVGVRPTFDDGRDLVAEAHVLDFDTDIYNREGELSGLALLRPERKFESLDELRAQIAQDVVDAREWLTNR